MARPLQPQRSRLRCRSYGRQAASLLLALIVIATGVLQVIHSQNSLSRIQDHLTDVGEHEVLIVDPDASNNTSYVHVQMNIDNLTHISLPHGTFFFAPNSHEVNIPASDVFDPSTSWIPIQRQLLEDSDIDIEEEKKRCASYDLDFPNTTQPLRRRRLFYGALISGDSKEVIKATSMEQYNIFHTVSLIESNVTFTLDPKQWRLFGSKDASKEVNWLYQVFGPNTKVSIDYYVTSEKKENQGSEFDAMVTERHQREGHVHRWKLNGMRPDDVVVYGDLDETYSRDFLRALQICDVPKFRPGQDCEDPKVLASCLIFESSPECIWKKRRWYHPDAILGECVEQIGDAKVHPQWKRNSVYQADEEDLSNVVNGQYPLWLPSDIRGIVGYAEDMPTKKDEWKSATAYHFHNYFMSIEEIQFKYATYGHADQNALNKRLEDIHGDLQLAVTCAKGKHAENAERSFDDIPGTSRPIYYLNKEVRQARHSLWQEIVRKEDRYWDSSKKSALLGWISKWLSAAGV